MINKKNKTLSHPQAKPKRIKEMAPICKSRKKYEKDSPTSKRVEDDDEGLFWLFSQINQQESLWLSSESLSPLYKGGDVMLMSPRGHSVDERLISLLSSYRGISFFDNFNSSPIKENLLEDGKDEDAESWLLDSSSNNESSSTVISKCSDSSSLFWDLDRTDLWVSLINLEGEDCKWISNVELDSENLESDFPSPTYGNKMRFDHVHSSEADVSSSMRSFHDELSSEILSGSLDLDDMEIDEPLMWPFDENYESIHTLYIFCQSPRRSIGSSSNALLKSNGRKSHSKEWWNRRFVAASGLNASKFIGFKRGSSRIVITSRNTRNDRSSWNSASKLGKKNKFKKGNLVIPAKRLKAMSLVGIDGFSSSSTSTKSQSDSSSSSMDFDSGSLWVSLINLNGEDSEWNSEAETDWKEILNSNFPSPSYKKSRSQIFWSSKNDIFPRDELSIEILTDEIDADEPLFWPYAKDQNWNKAWDSFCTSPRRDGHRIFGKNPTSIRVRIHDQRAGFKKSVVAASGLSASKIFKRGNGKRGDAKRAKAMNSRIGRSVARKFARSVGEKMEVIMENDVEGVAVEKILGFQEFDGHEGLDLEFHAHSFSILEE